MDDTDIEDFTECLAEYVYMIVICGDRASKKSHDKLEEMKNILKKLIYKG